MIVGLFAVIIVARGAALPSDNIVTTNVCDLCYSVLYMYSSGGGLRRLLSSGSVSILIYIAATSPTLILPPITHIVLPLFLAFNIGISELTETEFAA